MFIIFRRVRFDKYLRVPSFRLATTPKISREHRRWASSIATLSPANIFVTKHTKVLYFGGAKVTQPIDSTANTVTLTKNPDHLTSPGTALGTVAYMSPKQIRGKDLDPRTDPLSLGVVLYKVATGVLPFCGDTSGVIFNAILERPPVRPSLLNPGLPA